MSDEQLPADEISRRIVTGMGLVYDLFKEMHSLFRLIAQGLENSEADVQPQGPKGYILPRGKKGVTVADRFLKTDMGLLVAIGVAGADESEDDDVTDEVGDDDEQEAEKDTAKVAISPDTQYLGIRAILFDPQADDPAKFQPVLVAGILGSMAKTGRWPFAATCLRKLAGGSASCPQATSAGPTSTSGCWRRLLALSLPAIRWRSRRSPRTSTAGDARGTARRS